MNCLNITHSSKPNLRNVEKYRYPEIISKRLNRDVLFRKQVGQDYLIYHKLSEKEIIFCVCDGHGATGHHYSYIASNLLITNIIDRWNFFRTNLENESVLKSHLNSLYQECENRLRDGSYESLDDYSGTTISIVMGFGNKLVCSNIGDSPILWKSNQDEEIIEVSEDHNCDSLPAVQFYLDHLKFKRLELGKSIVSSLLLRDELAKLKPRSICCNRINCEGGPVWNHLRDSKGLLEKQPMYTYIDDETAIVNLETYEKVSEYFPHGLQSVRYPETYIREDGRLVVKSGEEHKNWGSALDNGPQCLRSFGDFVEGEHNPCIASINLIDVSCGGILVVGSDGLLDIFEYSELFREIEKCQEDTSSLSEYMFRKSETLDDFNYKLKNISSVVKVPEWDDVSGFIIRF